MKADTAHFMAAQRNTLKKQLLEKSTALGFDDLRIVAVDSLPDFSLHLNQWLEQKYYGTMDFMRERADLRASPKKLWPDAKSALLVAMRYKPDSPPLEALTHKNNGTLASYSQRRDYHDILKGKLKELAAYLYRKTKADAKVFVDTGLLMEKPLAERAGLGWQGKHTVLVSRTLGSWLCLGAILTTAELQADEPETNHCGSCRRCLDICPTQAFPSPFQLDARRCIAYYTVEHKGLAPHALRPFFGNRIFGCDDCVAICPWNKFSQTCREVRFSVRSELLNPPLGTLLKLDDTAFRTFFSATPVKRIGRDRFIRNVLIACGNSHDYKLISPIVALLQDASPLVRSMAIWALEKIDSRKALDCAHKFMVQETDPLVLEEWQKILKTPHKATF